MLGTSEQLVAGLGASGDGGKRKAGDDGQGKGGEKAGDADSVGNAPLRLWIGERFLGMHSH